MKLALWLEEAKVPMKVFVFLIMTCFFVLTPLSGVGASEKAGAHVQGGALPVAVEFEGGKLYYAGNFRIVELSGSYHQMGRQYGGLLGKEIRGMASAVEEQYALNGLKNRQASLADFSTKLFNLYPQRFKELAKGMTETSQVTPDKIAILNGFFDYALLGYSNLAFNNRCSAISVWGDYTAGSQLLIGRNFDFPAFFRKFDPYITVVAYNPSDSSLAAAVVAYPGQIGSIQVFNNKGVVVEDNDGSSSGDPKRYFGERTPSFISDLEIALDQENLAGVDAALQTRRLPYPLIFQAADSTQAYGYEMTTDTVMKRTENDAGLLVTVNHFINPKWKDAIPNKMDLPERVRDSEERQQNMLALAESYKNKFTSQVVMKILDIPVEQGGPTPDDRSIYQFVFEPQHGVLWLKARGYSDWTEIHLANYLHAYQGSNSSR